MLCRIHQVVKGTAIACRNVVETANPIMVGAESSYE